MTTELSAARLIARERSELAEEVRLSGRIERLFALREVVGGAHALTGETASTED